MYVVIGYIFMSYGLVIIIERLWSAYIYDIDFTHTRHLTPLLPQNLKAIVL